MIAGLAARAAATAGLTPGEITFTAVLSLTRAAITSDTCCPHCHKRPASANAPLAGPDTAILALPPGRAGRARPRRPPADLRPHRRRTTQMDQRTSQLHPDHRPVKSPESRRKSRKLRAVGVGLVDLAAYQSFKAALSSGAPADFENIVIGGPRTLNGPQGGLAWYLDCLDSSQFAVPPAPALASEAYASELVEMYWASLLRDVAFTAYPANGTAAQAAAELSAMPTYTGPRNAVGQVTPELLFRGRFAGETTGPYVSQFLLHPTALGSLPIVPKYVTNEAGTDFMTMADEFLSVQNGVDTGKRLTPGAALHLHDGRGLAAYTPGLLMP